MNEGILYVYTDCNLTLEQKVNAAVQQYRLKLKREPNCVQLNEGQLDGQTVNLEGVRIVGARNIPKHHFWVGVGGEAEQEAKPEPDAPAIYLAHQPQEVAAFLEEHPHLIDVLTEAMPHFRAHFGPDVKVALAVKYDPEIEGIVDLVASIQVGCGPDEALGMMDAFDEGWWLGQLQRAEDLIFMLEFVD